MTHPVAISLYKQLKGSSNPSQRTLGLVKYWTQRHLDWGEKQEGKENWVSNKIPEGKGCVPDEENHSNPSTTLNN